MAGTKKRRDSSRRLEKRAEGPPDVPPRSDGLLRVRDLRKSVEEANVSWTVAENLRDGDVAPRFPLGGEATGRIPAEEAASVDWAEVMQDLPTNPGLLARRFELELLSDELSEAAHAGFPRSEPRVDDPRANPQDDPPSKRGTKSPRGRNERGKQQPRKDESGS